jgi:hypothetical protein
MLHHRSPRRLLQYPENGQLRVHLLQGQEKSRESLLVFHLDPQQYRNRPAELELEHF